MNKLSATHLIDDVDIKLARNFVLDAAAYSNPFTGVPTAAFDFGHNLYHGKYLDALGSVISGGLSFLPGIGGVAGRAGTSLLSRLGSSFLGRTATRMLPGAAARMTPAVTKGVSNAAANTATNAAFNFPETPAPVPQMGNANYAQPDFAGWKAANDNLVKTRIHKILKGN